MNQESSPLFLIEKNTKEKFKFVFTTIYDNKLWNDDCKSGSGFGSDVEYNLDTYIPFLRKFIIDHNIISVVDLGCGDFLCGPHIYNDLDVMYYGYDVYSKIIDTNKNKYINDKYQFQCLDIFNDWENIVSADLCIIKDVLQHWVLRDIYTFLDNICLSNKFKYILICNCCDQEGDNFDMYFTGCFRRLSAKYYPLKRYDPIILYTYHTKEVSLICPPYV